MGDDQTASSNSTTDDGGATDDGILNPKAQGSASDYAALLQALQSTLKDTLSINPFAIDLAQATPILALCGALAGCILLGSLFFSKIDAGERVVEMDKRAKEMHLIRDIIKKKVMSESEKLVLNGTSSAGANQIKPVSERQAPSAGFLSRLFGGSGAQRIATTASEGAAAAVLQPVSKKDVWDGDAVEAIEIDDEVARNLSGHFANAVLPDESLSFATHYTGDRHVDIVDSFSWRTLMIVLENHYMTHFWFGGASIAKSRMIRYLETCRGIMINVFMYGLLAFYAFDADAHVPSVSPPCADTRCFSRCSTRALRCARRSRPKPRARRRRRRSAPASSNARGPRPTAAP